MNAEKGFIEDMESVFDNAEEALRRISGQCRLQRTCHSDIFCSRLPAHWRSNKSLPTPFIILALCPVPDGTRVCVSAGNDENFCADVKNNTAEFTRQMARFSDLRFVGKSGRGKNFNLSITIFTIPYTQVVIVPNILKVTVDGPRETRTTSSKSISDQHLSFPKKFRLYDGQPKIYQQQIDNYNKDLDAAKAYNKNVLDSKMSQPILKESKCITSSILTQQQQNFPFLLPQNRLRFNTQTAATLMSGLINPRLYFENLAAEARNKFGIENNFRLKTSINLDNIFHRSVSGASTYQMTTLNETIRNEQQKINSQMNNFSKLLIPSYCSTTFPSPSQFIPIQSFPSISSWQTLFKNNNAKNLQEQETKFKENPLYMLQPPSITHKSNENSLTAHAEGEDVINESKPMIRKRRYSGTASSDTNGWQKDEPNKEMVKRSKLAAKDEVDNKNTTSGKNKDNEISSPQPILKPQTQQRRLWRPFPL